MVISIFLKVYDQNCVITTRLESEFQNKNKVTIDSKKSAWKINDKIEAMVGNRNSDKRIAIINKLRIFS